MKPISLKAKIILAVFAIVFIVLFFLPSLVKNYVVNHSQELIGRKIDIDELHFNYLKIALRVKGAIFYEKNGVDQFVSLDELYIDASPWKLLSEEYSIAKISLDGLKISVIKDSVGFNFDDLLTDDKSDDNKSDSIEENSLVKFSVYDIEIINGKINYLDREKDNLLNLSDINIALPHIAWDNSKSEMGVDFSLGKNGNVRVDANVDHRDKRYQIDLDINSVEINPFLAYAKDYMHVSNIEGVLNTNLKLNGSLTNYMDLFVKGNAELNHFSVFDSEGNKFLKADTAKVRLDSINISSSHYKLGKIELINSEIYAVLDTSNFNFEKIFEPVLRVDTLVSINDSLHTQEPELFYSVDSVVVKGGLFQFSDKTLNRTFIYDVKDIDLQVGYISDSAENVPIIYTANLNDGGMSEGRLNFNMKEIYDFNLDAKVVGLELMSFSPYTEYYIARPITQGTLNYECKIDLKPNQLKNQNKVKISEFEFGKKTSDPNTIKVPVRMALYLLKDKNDIIQFDLPVSGNPKEPNFKVGKIIWKSLSNFLIKTAAKPFKALANISGINPENIETIDLHFLQAILNEKEKSTLKNISKILRKKPDLVFSLTQETDIKKESNYISMELCAKDFYSTNSQKYPQYNASQLTDWANQEPEFKSYLTRDSTDLTHSIEELCWKYSNAENVSNLVDDLIQNRNQFVVSYLRDSLQVSESNFVVKTADLRNLSVQQKEPKYRVEISIK